VVVEKVSPRWLDEHVASEKKRGLLAELGIGSFVTAPMLARGRTQGAVAFVRARPARSSERTDREVLEEFARKAGAGLDNARLYAAAMHAMRIREELLSVVSHDLRTPLGSISLCAQSLYRRAKSDVDAPVRKHAERILRAVDRMTHLVNDLLDLARRESGQFRVEKRPVEVASILAELRDILEPLAEEKSLELVIEHDPPGLVGSLDRARIVQVLSNLVDNAIKFTPAGGKITVRATEDDERLVIKVADTGLGVSDEVKARLFHPYWQRERDDRRGIGLGLSIAKAIVEAHGGTIVVSSEAGRGSEFTVLLPFESVHSGVSRCIS
jgi:signal transduction histidine kinase